MSADPNLVEKVHDLVGLYIARRWPPRSSSIDEKPQIRALNRTALTLPVLPTTPARATSDCERNRTCDLFVVPRHGEGDRDHRHP